MLESHGTYNMSITTAYEVCSTVDPALGNTAPGLIETFELRSEGIRESFPEFSPLSWLHASSARRSAHAAPQSSLRRSPKLDMQVHPHAGVNTPQFGTEDALSALKLLNSINPAAQGVYQGPLEGNPEAQHSFVARRHSEDPKYLYGG